jgi:hypothetical protein
MRSRISTYSAPSAPVSMSTVCPLTVPNA